MVDKLKVNITTVSDGDSTILLMALKFTNPTLNWDMYLIYSLPIDKHMKQGSFWCSKKVFDLAVLEVLYGFVSMYRFCEIS